MFGFFKTKPPIGPLEKAWTENRMQWLAQEFGIARLLETPTLVPDYAGIPDATNYDEAMELLDFLRAWIKIDATNVRLQIHGQLVTPEMIAKPDEIDNPITVTIQEDDFQHRDTLIAALARGLAYGAIAERGLHHVVGSDNGWTAELLPAYLGLGAFAANATIHDANYSDAQYTAWSVARKGPLPSRVFGYAMALRHYVRGDESHEWSVALRQDAKVAFEEGCKFLAKTDDSTFSKQTAERPAERLSADTLQEELRNGSDSAKISSMWHLAQLAGEDDFQPNQAVSDLVVDCIRARDADIRSVAVATLPTFDRSQHAAQEVADCLSDSSGDVRAAAAAALGDLVGVDDVTLVQDLVNALKDDSDDVVLGAVSSLARFGSAAEPASKTILKRLRRSFVSCNDSESLVFLNALVQITDDPEVRIREFFGETDDEYLGDCLELLEQLQNPVA